MGPSCPPCPPQSAVSTSQQAAIAVKDTHEEHHARHLPSAALHVGLVDGVHRRVGDHVQPRDEVEEVDVPRQHALRSVRVRSMSWYNVHTVCTQCRCMRRPSPRRGFTCNGRMLSPTSLTKAVRRYRTSSADITSVRTPNSRGGVRSTLLVAVLRVLRSATKCVRGLALREVGRSSPKRVARWHATAWCVGVVPRLGAAQQSRSSTLDQRLCAAVILGFSQERARAEDKKSPSSLEGGNSGLSQTTIQLIARPHHTEVVETCATLKQLF